ncbi:MAG: hypothetical protein LH616_11880 [Ilumatobacteraceae bacterium]|nr:hypothetical protein [Ilumatobacteraceae bacterium]
MFDPLAMCRILNEEGVEYVILGGFGAIIHGSPLTTRYLDVVPQREADNLDRLGRALGRMGAQIRIDGGAVDTRIDGPFLANMPHILNLVTDLGEMDLTFTPAGPRSDFDGWRKHAAEKEIGEGLMVWVAALDDIIASKRAANRPKDQMALPYLESLRDQLDH